ncbi:hypothetical protein TRVL_05966 [Trypanosoma vivax]|uniref:Vacuolar import/degradation Vid27 C-terminal domain-containing protein n=1 Tax=Trypanosoma vivax (strain Y486) TaxID=1055687 RepID=G0U023_TRYVY|nr:hypothetical protein TRVL_05966 [Trypanosoma vivax]CCC49420.1 conserved hypothetical protein [Trypanosoma vivax Y486]
MMLGAIKQSKLGVDMDRETKRKVGSGNVCHSPGKSCVATARCVIKKTYLHTFSFDSDGFEDGEAQCACLHDVKKCSAMLLDDAEKRTLVLSSGNSQLHEVDLERGCVVRQLGMPECVTAITYGAHVPRPEPVYTCLTVKAVFNEDLRMPYRRSTVSKSECVVTWCSPATRKGTLNCHATSSCGHLVTGDSWGVVRLCTAWPSSCCPGGECGLEEMRILLEARTPILDVDVTADGKYALATTRACLFFLRTYDIENGCSYVRRSGKGSSELKPLRLQPTNEQANLLGGTDKLNFTSGKFDRYGVGQEVCITACGGKLICTWDFETVISAMEKGLNACQPHGFWVGKRVREVSAPTAHNVMYLTDDDIRMAPLICRSY